MVGGEDPADEAPPPRARAGTGARRRRGLADPRAARRLRCDARRRSAPRARRRRRRFAPGGTSEPEVLLAGLLHDAGKGNVGLVPRVIHSLGQANMTWVARTADWLLADAPIARAAARPRRDVGADRRGRRLLAANGRADPLAGRPARPRGGRAPAPRRRGELTWSTRSNRRLAAAGGPVVRIEPGRGRDWATHVAIAEWEGPLGLLLSLIEARRFDVLTVPLGGVAEAYLEALATIEHDRMSSISSFVAVASQLILIKSRAMLPRAAGRAPPSSSRTRAPIRRRSSARGCSCTRRSATPARRSRLAAIDRGGLFRREPAAALAAGLAGAATAPSTPPIDPVAARPRPRLARPGPARPGAPARGRAALDHARPARRDHPARAAGRLERSSSRTCCAASAIASSSP